MQTVINYKITKHTTSINKYTERYGNQFMTTFGTHAIGYIWVLVYVFRISDKRINFFIEIQRNYAKNKLCSLLLVSAFLKILKPNMWTCVS